MAYVYEHWRPDTNVCFYVGKGTKRRANELRRLNMHHNNIIKHLSAMDLAVDIRIIQDGLTDEAAYSLEIERIAFWKTHGVVLTNKSTGGRGGLSGCKRSEESKKKQSAAGRKLSYDHAAKTRARLQSLEWREFISQFHIGQKRPEGTGAKISASVKRSWEDPVIRGRRLAGMKTTIISEETRAKMCAAKTPETRAKISAAAKRQWENPEFRKLVSDTMRRTNESRKAIRCAE